MTAFFNKFRRGSIPIFLLLFLISTAVILSCEKDDLETRSNFPFEVKVMPVPSAISEGRTAEIRVRIEKTGQYEGTKYFIRYFQFEGQGILQYYDQPPYLPNDLHLLPSENFRLYYTSNSLVSQSFDIWISDNFGNEKKLSFEFNSSD
ncbi:DUF3872 domain-containing protein [Flavobacterium sp. LHD-85]|uniref:DUF3872 domain-containing protein n=1 Tax=Flavobacterium sp. LHD-85 TaxID=3071410 RepID=UPI0027DF8E3B|nr:DUF3872 domain-containing protein [Flavobacterium sp. LHD-85]MDQ6532129.1 DUF3872 domain-containing protein [Flavobacterium sp. LHD-85]